MKTTEIYTHVIGRGGNAVICPLEALAVRNWFSDTPMKTTKYFSSMKHRPDRAGILNEWIQFAVTHPEYETIQSDGRIRRWARIREMENKYLRVILLADGVTVHNAFFDRGFKP